MDIHTKYNDVYNIIKKYNDTILTKLLHCSRDKDTVDIFYRIRNKPFAYITDVDKFGPGSDILADYFSVKYSDLENVLTDELLEIYRVLDDSIVLFGGSGGLPALTYLDENNISNNVMMCDGADKMLKLLLQMLLHILPEQDKKFIKVNPFRVINLNQYRLHRIINISPAGGVQFELRSKSAKYLYSPESYTVYDIENDKLLSYYLDNDPLQLMKIQKYIKSYNNHIVNKMADLESELQANKRLLNTIPGINSLFENGVFSKIPDEIKLKYELDNMEENNE